MGAKPVGAATTEKAEQVARTLVAAALAVIQRSANSPQEVRRRPPIADDVQQGHERVSAGQPVFSGVSR